MPGEGGRGVGGERLGGGGGRQDEGMVQELLGRQPPMLVHVYTPSQSVEMEGKGGEREGRGGKYKESRYNDNPINFLSSITCMLTVSSC